MEKNIKIQKKGLEMHWDGKSDLSGCVLEVGESLFYVLDCSLDTNGRRAACMCVFNGYGGDLLLLLANIWEGKSVWSGEIAGADGEPLLNLEIKKYL